MTITAGKLAEIISARVVGDSTLELSDISKIEDASSGDVTFVANPKYQKYLKITRASAIIIDSVPEVEGPTYLITEDPYGAFLKTLSYFHPPQPLPEAVIHHTAVISESSVIGSNVSIGANCFIGENTVIGENTLIKPHVYIGDNVSIGANCLFHSRVSIREGCQIGDRVIFQDGAVIGSDGFGFAPQESAYVKIPQVGRVIIEDDVEIGANTTVDRATLGVTRICKGAKIDNLVQIAHNVVIGENTVIAAGSGIAGSTQIGRNSMLGGQVGITGHIRLSDGVMIAAQAGVSKDPGPGKIIAGYPAREINEWRRIEAALSRLPDLIKKFRRMEKDQLDK